MLCIHGKTVLYTFYKQRTFVSTAIEKKTMSESISSVIINSKGFLISAIGTFSFKILIPNAFLTC
jgi:hypothetical protein